MKHEDIFAMAYSLNSSDDRTESLYICPLDDDGFYIAVLKELPNMIGEAHKPMKNLTISGTIIFLHSTIARGILLNS